MVQKLMKDEPLEEKFRDHDLHGNYEGYQECIASCACLIRADLLLVYTKGSEGELLILTLYRISSHTNIFDIKKRK